MKKKLFVYLLLILTMSSCYINGEVESNEVGAQLTENKITNCVGPGIYSGGFFEDLIVYSTSTIELEVSDPQVATSDTQLVGVTVTIQVQRKGDCESTKSFLTNWRNLLDDEALKNAVDSKSREAIKNGVHNFTLTAILGDRDGLADSIEKSLQLDTDKFNVEVINATVEDIKISEEYAQILEDTAQLKASEEYERRRQTYLLAQAQAEQYAKQQEQITLAEQLKVEEAKTAIEVEIAEREGAKIEALNQVYINNPYAYELEKYRLLRYLFGEGTVYFMHPGENPSLFFNFPTALPIPQ